MGSHRWSHSAPGGTELPLVLLLLLPPHPPTVVGRLAPAATHLLLLIPGLLYPV